jgi:NADH:ubiquinone oxidoreductase subunit 3 (subunit A)
VLIIALAIFQIALAIFLYVEDAQLSPLESGFESLRFNAVIRSSFFVLAALFVIFDVELILLFPGILAHLEIFFVKIFG